METCAILQVEVTTSIPGAFLKSYLHWSNTALSLLGAHSNNNYVFTIYVNVSTVHNVLIILTYGYVYNPQELTSPILALTFFK